MKSLILLGGALNTLHNNTQLDYFLKGLLILIYEYYILQNHIQVDLRSYHFLLRLLFHHFDFVLLSKNTVTGFILEL